MNTARIILKPISLGALLALVLAIIAPAATAGPSPQSWTRTKPINTTKEAAAVKSGDKVIMICRACKTVKIWEPVYTSPSGGTADDASFEWFNIGSKHKCDHCGGEITIVRGKTTDSMQHNCSMCGEGAAFCCVAPPTMK